MKKLHIIISIIGLSLASIAIFVYAADLGNRAYKIGGNTDIEIALNSAGEPPGPQFARSNIPEHGTVKEINSFSCANDVFVPTKTAAEFSSWYGASHSCYNVTTMPQPACGATADTCSEGTVENEGSTHDQCGKECLKTELRSYDTWDCTNLQGTKHCTYDNGCAYNLICNHS